MLNIAQCSIETHANDLRQISLALPVVHSIDQSWPRDDSEIMSCSCSSSSCRISFRNLACERWKTSHGCLTRPEFLFSGAKISFISTLIGSGDSGSFSILIVSCVFACIHGLHWSWSGISRDLIHVNPRGPTQSGKTLRWPHVRIAAVRDMSSNGDISALACRRPRSLLQRCIYAKMVVMIIISMIIIIILIIIIIIYICIYGERAHHTVSCVCAIYDIYNIMYTVSFLIPTVFIL